jgi:hypothetical protein
VAEGLDVIVDVRPVVRKHPFFLDISKQPPSSRKRVTERNYTTKAFARVGEHLTLAKVYLQQPFAAAHFREADRLPFAIVKYVRCLVYQEILKATFSLEIGSRYIVVPSLNPTILGA